MHFVHKISSPFTRPDEQPRQYSGKNNAVKSAIKFSQMFFICFDGEQTHLCNKFFCMSLVEQFNEYRSKMNEKILAADNLIIKRIFNLDTNAYQAGVLDVKAKELIGLTCSLVLRCDDCVKYH